MFDNNIFEQWLDTKSKELIQKIGEGKSLSSEEMIILVLKAQSNHFHHLDKDIREEMKSLREDTTKQIIACREDTHREIISLREDMDKRFEQVDKRFEQVDKRFEQIDKRFEQVDRRFDDMLKRMDRFMIWSLGLVMASTFFIIKFLS